MNKVFKKSILSAVLFLVVLLGQAQTGPNMVIPTNGSTDQAVNISIYVSIVTNATTYTLEVDTLPSFSASTIIKTGSRIQTFNGLAYGKTYYVRAKTELTGYGVVKTFSTITPTTALTSPAEGATCVSKTAAIYCAALSGANTYYWEFNTASDFTGTSVTKTTSIAGVFPGTSVNDFTTYYVRVRAFIASQGMLTNWGPGRQITFGTATPAPTYIRLMAAASSPASRTYSVNNYNAGASYTWTLTGGTIVSGQGTGTIVTNGAETAISVNETNSCGRSTTLNSVSNQMRSSVWAPITGTTGYRNQFKVWFAPVPGVNTPSAYRLQVSTAPTFTTNVYDVVGNASQTVLGLVYVNYNSVVLQYNTCYYMRVSVNGGGFGKVTTICIGNPVTFLTDPVNNSTGVNTKGYLTSGVVTGATAYSLELDTVNTFNSGAKKIVNSANHSYYVNDLLFNKKYYARVRATVGGVVQPYGVITNFTTTTLPTTYLTSPINGATDYPIGAHYYCKDAGNVNSYDWEFNTASDFTGTSILKTTAINNVYVGDQLQPLTTYYVRVKANQSAQSLYGAWGPVYSFTTPAGAGARYAFEEELVIGEDAFVLYPNPANDVCTIDLIEATQGETVTIELINMQGGTVLSKTVKSQKGFNQYQLNVEQVPGGIYTVRVSGGDSVLYSRLVVE